MITDKQQAIIDFIENTLFITYDNSDPYVWIGKHWRMARQKAYTVRFNNINNIRRKNK